MLQRILVLDRERRKLLGNGVVYLYIYEFFSGAFPPEPRPPPSPSKQRYTSKYRFLGVCLLPSSEEIA